MIYFKLVLENSPIHGKGLFAGEEIPKAKVVVNWLDDDAHFTTEEQHLKHISESEILSKSSIRLVGDIFLYGEELGDTDHINHSDTPNLLYHAGLCYSLRDIGAGEELTLDYRLLNSEKETDVVAGYDAEKTLQLATGSLLRLFRN